MDEEMSGVIVMEPFKWGELTLLTFHHAQETWDGILKQILIFYTKWTILYPLMLMFHNRL